MALLHGPQLGTRLRDRWQARRRCRAAGSGRGPSPRRTRNTDRPASKPGCAPAGPPAALRDLGDRPVDVAHNDFVDYRLVDAFIGHGEHVRSGSPAQNADRIKAPVLLFHGDLDQNVAVGESQLMESKLRTAGKQVRFVEYKGLTHQLDDSDVRTDMLGKSDAFLRATLGMKD
ncbi:hypothetical protein SUS17_3299 [Sphingomonas sp. S17]|uniref:alpha/beta hydrolase family protein n=1 Tax=Sphingomonas TaxID=13687 RepID=UPI00020A242A|nr:MULTISPECIES: prolyl oligopeptidase family serine peptidase [Sphingomonas]EGI53846.1 hypothetical protein SUS17_3299 [Sphingomonas sp. S17]MCM3681336.1 prolyl oligopeptidase family serine peptidase [Sphingomonas paucimobilis]